MSMLRMKSLYTVLALAVIVSLGQMAFATDASVTVIAGSSALWQTMALGAYNGTTSGGCPNSTTYVPPCYHWTSGSNKLTLVDSRPATPNDDAATMWVVWDSATTSSNGIPNIWMFAKVDSVVGDRCFFAKPACRITDTLNPTTNADWSGTGGNQIKVVWGSDVALPTAVFNYVSAPANVAINVAATDIRPEDAWWAMSRTNSALGASAVSNNSDGTDGLGYNSNNASGVSPNYVTATTGECSGLSQAAAVGTPVYSAFQTTSTSTDTANVLAFNILGKDPITCSSLATYTVANVGATPVVFVNSRTAALANLQNASEYQLDQVFSGANTDASAFGLPTGKINAYLREPTSGTMNTTEATVFRFPTTYATGTAAAGVGVAGVSQEECTGTPTGGSTSNPLNLASSVANAASSSDSCGGSGYRFRAIGTSEEVNSVLCGIADSNSKCSGAFTNAQQNDGIGYTFFSYGNVSVIAGSSSYGYITLNGIDPIFTTYQGGIDPGQPAAANGQLPPSTPLPECEDSIWGLSGLSYPNVRNGSYRAWSILRMVYGSTETTAVTALVKASNTFVVTSVPDYIPFAKITLTAGTCPANALGTAFSSDPGFLLVRSHYQERSGSNQVLGNSKAIANITTENGGDMGGAILVNDASSLGLADSVTQLVSSDNANAQVGNGQAATNNNLSPIVRQK
jgi:hypothetical protein